MHTRNLFEEELMRYATLDDSVEAIECRLEIARRVLADEWGTDEIEALQGEIEWLKEKVADLESEKYDLLDELDEAGRQLK